MKTVFYTLVLMVGYLTMGYGMQLYSVHVSTYLSSTYGYVTKEADLLLFAFFGTLAFILSYKKLLTLSQQQRNYEGSRQ